MTKDCSSWWNSDERSVQLPKLAALSSEEDGGEFVPKTVSAVWIWQASCCPFQDKVVVLRNGRMQSHYAPPAHTLYILYTYIY